MARSRLTIGFVPRERFSVAPEALRTLLRNTPETFELLVVDPGTPEPWRTEIAELVEGHPGAKILGVAPENRPFLPNRARNLVIEHADGDWICLLENDVLVAEDWLKPLLEAAECHNAGVAVPLILERFGPYEKVHFDDRLHRIRVDASPGEIERRIEKRGDSKERDRGGPTRKVDFIETHCMLFRREALERVGGFDASITAQEEIDISMALHAGDTTAVLVPASIVTFLPPPPVYPVEREYYLAKWNPVTYAEDHDRMRDRWDIANYPSAVGVVEARRAMADGDVEEQVRRETEHRATLEATRADLAPLLDRGPLILVHDNQLDLSLVCPEGNVLPFLERNGDWWGPPPDSATAIEELERMRAEEAATIAFASTAAWWLDYYDDLATHLRRNYEIVRATNRVTAYALDPDREIQGQR